jgi:hypothetical protein
MKKCSSCSKLKTYDNFYIRKNGSYRGQCKACLSDYYHRRYIALAHSSRKVLHQASLTWQREHPDVIRNRHLKRKYGITLTERNTLLEKQDHKCAICLEEENDRRLQIDHDHITGKIRGLLCSRCNVAIGLFLDNPDFLILAAAYLNTTHEARVKG